MEKETKSILKTQAHVPISHSFSHSQVHNISVLAETPLLNYTHFLIYTASALAEQLVCRRFVPRAKHFEGYCILF